jgi:N-acetylmuramoyl-L-alanine amidase
MLGGAAAAGAGALLAPVAEAAAGLEGRRVFSRYVGHLSGQSAVLGAGRRFALAGIEWSEPVGARIELRTRRRDGWWGPWALASVTGHDADGGHEHTAPMYGEPVWAGAADVIQLRSPAPVSGLRLHFVTRAASGPPAARALGGPLAGSAAALPLAHPVLDAGPGQPPIIARSAWAGHHAPPAQPAFYGAIDLAFVHHTDNPNGYSRGDVAPMLLAIFDYHRYVRGFFDIAYNFIIDAFGRIWEARAGGIDEPVIGAHAGAFNEVSTGVAVLGTFMFSVPPPAAIRALEQLLAWKLSLHGIPTTGKVRVEVDPADAFYTPFKPGAHVLLPRVAGHRDGDLTDCPGNDFYHRLPSIRPLIARLASRPAKLTVAPATSSVLSGAELTLTGKLALLHGGPIAGAPIEIQRLANDEAHPLATATTASDGSWTTTVVLAHTAVLRALHASAPAAASNVIDVGLMPVITLTAVSTSPLRLSGTVTPAKPHVILDVYELVSGRRHLRHSQSIKVTRGQFTVRPKLSAGHSYVLVARTAVDSSNLAGASPPLTVSV